jgi:hypothetical protein
MRSVCLTNFKMKKWINIHKKSVGWDKVVVSPAEMGEINKGADEIFARLDVNKVSEVNDHSKRFTLYIVNV